MEQLIWFLPNAYPVELVHLGFAVIGLAANIATFLYAFGDLKYTNEHHQEFTPSESKYRLFISHRNTREESARLALNVIFVGIGLVSIFNPPPSPYPVASELTFQLEYTRITLTLGSLFLTFKSVTDLTDRHKLRDMMRKSSGETNEEAFT